MPEFPVIEDIWAQFPVLQDIWPLVLLGFRLLVALLLYLFLFSAFRALYAELRPAPAAAPVALPADRARGATADAPAASVGTAGRPAWIEIVECDGHRDLVGRRFPLHEETLVGRRADAAVTIADPRVSARHALIFEERGEWWVEDLGSTNGTFVDEIPVDGPAYIDRDTEIRFGPAVARLRVGGRR